MSFSEGTSFSSNVSQIKGGLEEFFAKADVMLLFIDPMTLEIERASRAAEDFYGWPPGALIGKKITEIDVRAENEIWENVRKTLSMRQLHFFIKHRRTDGKIFDVEVFSGRLPYRAHPLIYAAMIDITEKKRNEDRLRRLAFEITQVEERERKRFASYLHDEIGQNLALIKMEINRLAQSASPAFSSDDFGQINNLLDRTIQQTRSMVFELSPPLLYKLGLSSALCKEGEKICKRNGIKFVFNKGNIPEFPDDRRALIFRCTQELLRNCIEHAKASCIRLSLRSKDSYVIVKIADNGIGFNVTSLYSYEKYDSFGLFSVKERLQAIGGALTIKSQIGKGTRVELVVPIH